MLELGGRCGAGRPSPRRRGPERDRAGAGPGARRRSSRRPPPSADCPSRRVVADSAPRPTFACRASRPLRSGRFTVIQELDGAARPALLAPPRRADGARRRRIALTVVDETTLLSAGAASTQILPDMRELDGWVYSSEPLWVQVGDDGAHRPPPARAGLPRRPAGAHRARRRPAPGQPRAPRARGRGGRACAARAGARSAPARTRPTPRSSCWRCRRERPGTSPARSLSRADEHLRGPGQHPLPPAPLRVARHRLRVCGRRAPATASTPPRTT